MTSQDTARQSNPPLIATMYERWTLDYIIELVQVIAVDFVCRPGQYRNVSCESSQILQNFRFHTGNSPKFPNRMQRSMTFEALLGLSDGMGVMEANGNASMTKGDYPVGSQLKTPSAGLREAARAYAEKQATQGEGLLIQSFVNAGRALQSYLRPIDDENRVVIVGNTQTKAIFDEAAFVLRDKTVTSRFSHQPAIPEIWPLGGIQDGNGSLLMQEIGKVLIPGMMPPVTLIPITQSMFAEMQNVASYGSRTITGVLAASFTGESGESLISQKERFEPLITEAYSWKTALDRLTKEM